MMFINEAVANVMLWKLFSLFNMLGKIFSSNCELGENVVPLTFLSFVSQCFVCCEIGRKLISQHPLTRQADRKWVLVRYRLISTHLLWTTKFDWKTFVVSRENLPNVAFSRIWMGLGLCENGHAFDFKGNWMKGIRNIRRVCS